MKLHSLLITLSFLLIAAFVGVSGNRGNFNGINFSFVVKVIEKYCI